MFDGWKLLIWCSCFSFFASLLKQLFDAKYYPKNIYVFVIDVLLSSVCGIVTSLILSYFILNELVVIGISGLGGLLGVSGIKAFMAFKVGKKIRVEIGFEDKSEGDIKLKFK